MLETKKTTSLVSPEYDKAKLRVYAVNFGYCFAAAIVFNTGRELHDRDEGYTVEYYDPKVPSGFDSLDKFLENFDNAKIGQNQKVLTISAE